MPARLQCPTCSAPLDPPDTHATAVRCPYCGAGVLLTERLGAVEATPAPDRHSQIIAEVVRSLRAGRKIDAIRIYREHFGGGLKEAREAVERIAAGQPAGSLPPASSPRRAIGCVVVAMLIAAGAGMLLSRRGADPAAENTPAPAAQAAPAPEPGKVPAQPGWATPVLRFGSEGTGAGRFQDARSVAVDGQGRIYVAEYSGGRVQVFDSLGAFLTQWMADPRMPLVDLAAVRGGTVYVAQSGRIRRYEGATGKPLGEVPRPDSRASYSEIAVALDGTLYAVAGFNEIVHLGADGGVLRTIDTREAIGDEASPGPLAVAGTGDLYVLDRWKGEVYRLNRDGRFVDRFGGQGGGPGQLRSPSDLAIDGRGRVYVSDLGAGIRVFNPDGQLLDSFGGGVVFGLAFNDRDELFAAFRNSHEIVKFRLER